MSEKTDVVKREATETESTRRIQSISPAVDIYENEDEILLLADMPGVTKEQIRVNLDNGELSLAGTRTLQVSGATSMEEFGDVDYRRNFSVPQTIDVEKINAVLKDGVLHLHLPKSAAAKPKQIKIKAG
jgi:HSP20 family molecular chaperone IbpA